jgi:hypothetical protein
MLVMHFGPPVPETYSHDATSSWAAICPASAASHPYAVRLSSHPLTCPHCRSAFVTTLELVRRMLTLLGEPPTPPPPSPARPSPVSDAFNGDPSPTFDYEWAEPAPGFDVASDTLRVSHRLLSRPLMLTRPVRQAGSTFAPNYQRHPCST